MKLYNIPQLFCPFHAGPVLPSAEVINEHLRSWMIEHQLAYNKLEFYSSQNYGAMIAASYPYAGIEIMKGWAELNCLLFCLDDFLDENIVDQHTQDAIQMSFLDVIDSQAPVIKIPVITAFTDFWRRFKPQSNLNWQAQFRADIIMMFEGGKWQNEHIRLGKGPDYTTYLKMRGYLGAAHLATNSLEVTAGVDFTTLAGDHTLTELNKSTQMLICIANDLFSLGKEVENSNGGAMFNIVSILAAEKSLSMEDAIRLTAEIHNSMMLQFVELAKTTTQSDNSIRYIDSLGALMAGNILWSTQYSTRYPHQYLG